MVRTAGRCWTIEECFEQANQLTVLDDCEVRSWIGWQRHITLSMLVGIGVQAHSPSRRKKGSADLIPEVRTLLATLFLHSAAILEAVLAFSRLRRQHQFVSRQSH